MGEAVIRYVCRNKAHQQVRSEVTSPVTLHDREWAFCPAGFIGEHAWERIEGTALDALRRRIHEVPVKL